jgi:hypothetical protein
MLMIAVVAFLVTAETIIEKSNAIPAATAAAGDIHKERRLVLFLVVCCRADSLMNDAADVDVPDASNRDSVRRVHSSLQPRASTGSIPGRAGI